MTNAIKNMLSNLAAPARLNKLHLAPAIDIMGPRVQILRDLNDQESTHCIMLVTVPPGVTVPLHSHADAESFYVVDGTVEMLDRRAGDVWKHTGIGNFVHIAPDSQHAFRNATEVPAAFLCATTPRMAQFFEAVGEPVLPDAMPAVPGEARVAQFIATANSFGYWLGSPEENAASGIRLAPPA
jgi:quercetin dioxygenase-like cupin family protein